MDSTQTPPRPRSLTPEQRQSAMMGTAQRCAEWAGDKDIEGWARLLADEAAYVRGGYDMAKRLDDRHGVTPDADLVEILEGVYYDISRAIEALESAWVETHDIRPPHPIGARVEIDSFHGAERGVLDEVYQYGAGKYCVKIDGTTDSSRRIVNFEDVRVLTDAIA